MFPLTLTILIAFTLIGLWLIHYESTVKRFTALIVFFLCFFLIATNNWLYLTETEIVTGIDVVTVDIIQVLFKG